MFVRPPYQQQGFGKILPEKAIELAKSKNYSCIRSDTLNYMTPPIKLYKKYGFYNKPAYYHSPNTAAVYFELKCWFIKRLVFFYFICINFCRICTGKAKNIMIQFYIAPKAVSVIFLGNQKTGIPFLLY
jgi:Acetyltransferase (GNAT) domain